MRPPTPFGLFALPSEKEKANAFVNAPLPKQAGAQKSTPPNGGLFIRAELFKKVFVLRRRKLVREDGISPNIAQNAGELEGRGIRPEASSILLKEFIFY